MLTVTPCVTPFYHVSGTLVYPVLLVAQFIEVSTIKSLPEVLVSKGLTSLLQVQNDVHVNPKHGEEFL